MICDYRCWCIAIDIILAILIFTCSFFGFVIVATSYPQTRNNEYFLSGLAFLIVDLVLIIIWVSVILCRKYRCPNETIYADV